MMKKQYTAALTVICACLGMMIGLQYNTVKVQSGATENARVSELSASLRQLEEENAALEAKVSEQETIIKEYEEEGLTTTAVQTLEKENALLREFAGLTEMTGEGITVTMRDSSTTSGGDRNAYLVHAEDILQVVNELNVAGAKAVSVNGQRVVAQSGITCAGTVITVNGVRLAAPFEIRALGDSTVLESALRFPDGIVDDLSLWGIEITIKAGTDVTVPAYKQTVLWQTEGEDAS